MRLVYPARLRRYSENDIVVSFRDLPECLTSGEDEAEALLEARDALEEAIAGRIDDAEGIPNPSQKRRGEYLVAVPPNTAAKAAVAIALERSGISKAALAKKLSIHERGVDRILDPRFPANTAMIDHALLALGSEIVMEVRDCPSNGDSPAVTSS